MVQGRPARNLVQCITLLYTRKPNANVIPSIFFCLQHSKIYVFVAFKFLCRMILFAVSLDVGDPVVICRDCKSRVWFEERAEQDMMARNAKFSLCCMKGKVLLPILEKPPELLYNLMNGNHAKSTNYLQNNRSYNSMFSFTSLGGKIQRDRNDGGGPPQFILRGQNYHRMGGLLPDQGSTPKFAQLYIYDTSNETANRVKHFRFFFYFYSS